MKGKKRSESEAKEQKAFKRKRKETEDVNRNVGGI